ncbi:hypothetical protein [Rickettsiales endosymbiont of Peranema trichophorum]|uniref:hypothetical protein n=1 Tax=Rickettsiales endosymbiont of Peranema trichophorum TaxID=2486577 RepID=UPI0013EED7C3|nr:hypothetical protein [Rickettsiales endosymbiont of Peranema trichophorum]
MYLIFDEKIKPVGVDRVYGACCQDFSKEQKRFALIKVRLGGRLQYGMERLGF